MSTNDAGIQIRAANTNDAPSIAAVLRAAFLEYEPLYTPEGFTATTPSADRILQRLSEGPIWVAVQGERVVGTVCAVPKGQICYVRGMAIVPSARGGTSANPVLPSAALECLCW